MQYLKDVNVFNSNLLLVFLVPLTLEPSKEVVGMMVKELKTKNYITT